MDKAIAVTVGQTTIVQVMVGPLLKKAHNYKFRRQVLHTHSWGRLMLATLSSHFHLIAYTLDYDPRLGSHPDDLTFL